MKKHIKKIADAIDTVSNYAEEVNWRDRKVLIYYLDQLWDEEVKAHLEKEEVSSFGCPECGSDNLEFEVWVNQHNDIINYGDQIWCNDCSESVKDIVSKSEYKKEEANETDKRLP